MDIHTEISIDMCYRHVYCYRIQPARLSCVRVCCGTRCAAARTVLQHIPCRALARRGTMCRAVAHAVPLQVPCRTMAHAVPCRGTCRAVASPVLCHGTRCAIMRTPYALLKNFESVVVCNLVNPSLI